MAYIYKITNKINGKSYIGKTEKKDPIERFKEHLREYKKERCEKRPLYSAIKKYGEENFEFEVLCETERPNEEEVLYIEKFKTYGSGGYNATLGGDGKAYVKIDSVELSKLYEEGFSIAQLSKRYSVCPDTISAMLHKNGSVVLSGAEGSARSLGKKVLQLTKKGEVLATFNSVAEAERFYNKKVGKTHIRDVCLGKRKTALGSVWKYD